MRWRWRISLALLVGVAGVSAWWALSRPKPFETNANTGAIAAMLRDQGQSPFAVGVTTVFAKDADRSFDPWGQINKPEAYREILAEIDAAGDSRTVHTQIYYPTAARAPAETDLGEWPAPLPAAVSGRLAEMEDFFVEPAYYDELTSGIMGWLGFRVPTVTRQSYVDAPLAEGRFPVILMLHGLGGGHMTWHNAAEYMASHGYVVATLAFTSDSTTTAALFDPDGEFRKTMSPEGLASLVSAHANDGGMAVFGGFFDYLYDFELTSPSMPDADGLSAVAGGGAKVGALMSTLFEQRVEDVQIVIGHLKDMNASGPFAGSMDLENIGLMGHSLGSITAQIALVTLDDVKTAIAANNGLPRFWEPNGGFPDASGDATLPDGVPKDILFLIGSDDNFVHTVFRDIFWRWWIGAGGDLSETMVLPTEQVWPTADNPQPIARVSYDRAQAGKMLITFKDQGHDNLTDEFRPRVGQAQNGRRVPLTDGIDASDAPSYEMAGWVDLDGTPGYAPHILRNYFMKAWFDQILKGDGGRTESMISHPFGDLVAQQLFEGLEVQ